MPYQNKPTRKAPLLIVLLIDISGSMRSHMSDGMSRMDVANKVIKETITETISSALVGAELKPTVEFALVAYSERVYDLLGGFKAINEISVNNIPLLSPQTSTDTAAGFLYVKELLLNKIDSYPAETCDNLPVPIVVHVCDGNYTTIDPSPVIHEVQNIKVPDGSVLVLNVYINEDMSSIENGIRTWTGYKHGDVTGDSYGDKLLNFSSVIPEPFQESLSMAGYKFEKGSVLFFPGNSFESIAFGVNFPLKTKRYGSSRIRDDEPLGIENDTKNTQSEASNRIKKEIKNLQTILVGRLV